MLSLTSDEIIGKINKGVSFEANATDTGLYIKIEEYIPFACFAIHDGSNFNEELKPLTNLTEKERWYEEDPYTKDFIEALSIVVAGTDSRFEYDLNRATEDCIYDIAWGKKVWKEILPHNLKQQSLNKHANFYKVVHALIKKLESLFKACVVYDIHSYNYQRIEKEAPVFNIGTENLNINRFNDSIVFWKKELEKIKFSNIENTVAINDVFYGRGYLLKYITASFDATLVLATEVKKIYCNEDTGEIFPLNIEELKIGLKKAIINSAYRFSRKNTNLKIVRKNTLLSSDLDKNILSIDKTLYRIVSKFEILNYINPINLSTEKKKFFKSGFSVNPEFRYKHLILDPFEFKRKLYALPVESIRDASIQKLYKDVINAYVDKVEILASIGTKNFLYNCLRYFGEPSKKEEEISQFILSCPTIDEPGQDEKYDAFEAKKVFEAAMKAYGFAFKVDISKFISSKAVVINSKQILRLNHYARFSDNSIQALIHHEVGVHVLTTMNSSLQPLKVFNLGLPLNTLTQEGLAIASEYFSGNLTITRLRELALRVLSIRNMIRGNDFKHTFLMLHNKYGMQADKAFSLTARVYRGGGFTKDFLYLKGFRMILKLMDSGANIENLLIGKTSHEYLGLINEMVDRRLILKPKFKTIPLIEPLPRSSILDYIVDGLKGEKISLYS